MGIYSTGDRMFIWRYTVSEIQLLIPDDKTYKIPNERLTSMNILTNYEDNAYPVFKIEIVLEPSLYYKIMKNKDTVQFHLRIQKYYNGVDNKTQSLKRDFINDTFSLILDDEASDLTDVIKREDNKYNFKYVRKNDLTNVEEAHNKIEFFLFKTSTIKGLNTKNVNAILKDCTVTDAMAYVLSTAGVNNVLMSPSHNNQVYDNIIIPPMPCLKALRFLDTYYGIYKTGSMMFFDFTYSYILQYDGKCTAYTQNEVQNTQIVIPTLRNGHSTQCCTISKRTDLTSNYIVADYRTLDIRDDTISNDIISDSNVKFINNYSGDVELSLSRLSSDNSSYRIQENKTENRWLGDVFTSQTSAIGTVVTALLMDYDINMVSPNKKLNLIFEDSALTSKYNGVYLLTSLNHNFVKEGSDFILNTEINMKKTK